MFHKRIGHIAAAILLLGVSSQSIISHASEPAAPAAVVQAQTAPIAISKSASLQGNFSLETLRQNTKTKLSDTQRWVKDKTQLQDHENPFKTLEAKIDRLQDHAAPAGHSIKSSVKKWTPGTGIIQQGDRKFSFYGLLLMLAFGVAFLLMSLSGPMSRLGGRH